MPAGPEPGRRISPCLCEDCRRQRPEREKIFEAMKAQVQSWVHRVSPQRKTYVKAKL